jgi:Ca-activated chloride channel homolog
MKTSLTAPAALALPGPVLLPGAPGSTLPFRVGLTFEHPSWLLLLVLAVPLALTGFWWFDAMSRARRISAVLFRVILISLITAMLAGASSVRRSAELAVVGVIDISGSVRMFGDFGVDEQGRPRDSLAAMREFWLEAAARRGADDLVGLVVFDGRALAVATPTRAPIDDRMFDVRMIEGTNIADALRYASALIPPGASGRLVLMSDGNQTSGDAVMAARELGGTRGAPGRPGAGAGRRIPVDVVPIALTSGAETLIENVDTPPRAAAESTVTVRVAFFSTQGSRGRLFLLREGEPLDIDPATPGMGREVEIPAGRHVELVQVQLPPGRIHRFEAVFEPQRAGGGDGVLVGDTRLENNRAEGFTISPGRGSVLVVDGVSDAAGLAPGAASVLARTLEESGIDVTVRPPQGLPEDLLDLQAFDLVILENVAADTMPIGADAALAAHVRDAGGGLVMVGGPGSFGAGGWRGTAIEEILPVQLDLPERLVQPDAAVMFIIDNSGSMARPVMGTSMTQQDIANRAAAMAVRSLAATDLVGVVVFNSETSTLVPLGPNSNPERTSERLLSISPGGGTILGPAMEEAFRQIEPASAALKHVIILSDGISLNRDMLTPIAARMQQAGIVVSSISIGDLADEENLADIAREGGGQFYSVVNPALLPRFVMRAVRIVRTPMVREGAFEPALLPGGSPLTAGLSQPPPLHGLVLTHTRPEATITYAMAAPTGEPLLAHWNVELGQVAAFTSDAHHWAREWLAWPGYRQMWTQIARTIARPAASERFDLATEVVGDSLHIRLDAYNQEGRPLDLLSVPAVIYTPSGQQIEVHLSQTAPGLYEGRAPARESGSYVAVLKPRLGLQRLAPVIGGASVASGLEFRRLDTDFALLDRIAAESGGRVLPLEGSFALLFDRSEIVPTVAHVPLWRSLLMWTLLVLLLDVGTRRIAWDRFVSRQFGADLRKSAAEAVRDRGGQAAATITHLRGGAKRADEEMAGASSAALSDDDARQVAAAAAQRRREARIAAQQATREARQQGGSPGAAPAPPSPAPIVSQKKPGDETASPPEEGTSGLLAAKRRARERLEENET